MTPNLTKLFEQATQGTLYTNDDEDPILLYVKLSEAHAGPHAISVLWESDWATPEDARLVILLHNHGQALIEALDRMTALVMETNKPGTLYSGDKDLIVSSIELLATLEREGAMGITRGQLAAASGVYELLDAEKDV
jgi:hypothetical protein